MNRFILFLLFITFTMLLKSKTPIKEIEKWREVLFDQMDYENNEQDINIVIDKLYELINNPILINICNKSDLEQLPFLSDRQIENLLYYRYMYGELQSIHELRMVEDFDYETISLITPFLQVSPTVSSTSPPVDNLFKRVRQQALIRCDIGFNEKEGYVDKSDSVLQLNPNKKYLGSPFYTAVRYRIEQNGKWQAGLVAEKDAGEKGLDYWNGYLRLQKFGMLHNLIIGSYKARLGNGLVINNAFSLGKSSLGASVINRNNGFSPHASTDEYNYLRGLAAEMRISSFSLYACWSYRSLDGMLASDTILSVKKDGLHALYREKQKKNRTDLISAAVALVWKGRLGQVGINGAYHAFNMGYHPEEKIYNLHAFRGKRMVNASVDYRLKYAGIIFSGETAVAESGGMALLHLLCFQPVSGTEITLLHRYYGKSYHSWFGRSFSEGSELSGESGFSVFVNSVPARRWRIGGNVDFFRFPYPKYGIDIPSSGYEIGIQTSYQQSRILDLNLRYRLKSKYKNRTGTRDSLPSVQSYQHHRLALRLNCILSESFFLKTAVEGNFYHFPIDGTTSGFLLSQSIGYKIPGIPLQADLLAALFDTDNTRTKVYLSEKSVLYGFGNPSFYGNGMRVACNLRYDVGKRITFWFKIANTRYFDRDEIGSGLERIRGKNKTDLWSQLQVKF